MADPAKKAAAKKAAAGCAVGFNDAAAVLAGTASGFGAAAVALAATGVGIPAGAGAAVIAGLASAGAWFLGDRYQELANDPPRRDFHLVSTFGPVNFTLQRAATEDEATWQEFLKSTFSLALAMRALVRSLERHDGAVNSTSAQAVRAKLLQIDAIRHNTAACAKLAGEIVAMRSKVNRSWAQLRNALATSGYSAVPLTRSQYRRHLKTFWGAHELTLRRAAGLSRSDRLELGHLIAEHIRQYSAPATLPKVLIGAALSKRIAAAETRLSALAAAF
jgi:hypothetical protein